MTRRNKKHILNQAKEQRELELSKVLDAAAAAYEAVYLSETATLEERTQAGQEVSAAREAMEEWRSLGKRNRKKIGRRVDWVAHRESTPGRTINRDALKELRAERAKSKKAQVGIEWLHEGALVTRRGETDMMIVTRIQGNTVECLNGTATQWYRNVALRPADWMMED